MVLPNRIRCWKMMFQEALFSVADDDDRDSIGRGEDDEELRSSLKVRKNKRVSLKYVQCVPLLYVFLLPLSTKSYFFPTRLVSSNCFLRAHSDSTLLWHSIIVLSLDSQPASCRTNTKTNAFEFWWGFFPPSFHVGWVSIRLWPLWVSRWWYKLIRSGIFNIITPVCQRALNYPSTNSCHWQNSIHRSFDSECFTCGCHRFPCCLCTQRSSRKQHTNQLWCCV